MSSPPVLRAVDAVTVPVPGLDEGLGFYRDRLGHPLLWRDDDSGTAGLALPDGESELVLTTRHRYEPDWLVTSVPDAVAAICAAGGPVVVEPSEIPVGRVAVVADPFANTLVLVDLSKGRYRPDGSVEYSALPRGAASKMIWHLAYASDWESAKQRGRYAVSTRGGTLAEVGFVHASYADQVPRVAAVLFADESAPLVALGISTGSLVTAGIEVREEPGETTDPYSERFPHVYGAIPVAAVVEVRDVSMVDGRLAPWES